MIGKSLIEQDNTLRSANLGSDYDALGLQLGGGAKGREAAALLFAAWQGQLLWQGAGGKGFKIKDAIKALT